MSAPPPKIRREEAQFSVRHHDYVDEDRRSRRRNGREDEHHYRAREGTARSDKKIHAKLELANSLCYDYYYFR